MPTADFKQFTKDYPVFISSPMTFIALDKWEGWLKKEYPELIYRKDWDACIQGIDWYLGFTSEDILPKDIVLQGLIINPADRTGDFAVGMFYCPYIPKSITGTIIK